MHRFSWLSVWSTFDCIEALISWQLAITGNTFKPKHSLIKSIHRALYFHDLYRVGVFYIYILFTTQFIPQVIKTGDQKWIQFSEFQ